MDWHWLEFVCGAGVGALLLVLTVRGSMVVGGFQPRTQSPNPKLPDGSEPVSGDVPPPK